MSTAVRVPETYGLDGDDARQTLGDVGKQKLLKDAFVRLRAADGTSHARSLAFMVSLCLVQALIVLLGIAASLGSFGLTEAVADNISGAVPGPAGSLLTESVEQARKLHERHEFVPLLMAVVGLVVTGTFAMGQVERGLNRIYGVERDRPAAEKYKRALYLALSVGPVFAVALLFIGFAPDPDAASTATLGTAWIYGRWLLAIALVVPALGLLLRFCPNRHQPGRAWLTFGALTGVVLWIAATILLALGFRLASTFPQTYGSLAGVVALLLWGYLSALAIFYGVAVAAQLEAERALSRHIAAPAEDHSARREGRSYLELLLKRCSTCGTLIPADGWSAHRAAHKAQAYGAPHRQRRAALLASAYGRVCELCGEVMLPEQSLDLDHSGPLAVDRMSVGDRIVHARCNRRRR